jgi:hypothetical protein
MFAARSAHSKGDGLSLGSLTAAHAELGVAIWIYKEKSNAKTNPPTPYSGRKSQ